MHTTPIRALVVEDKDAQFVEQELELEEPARGEALVRIVAAGVCHTDQITRHGDMPMPFPAVLGHEGAGIVERVGEGVTQVATGDKVIIGWPSCSECRNCLDGQPRYCLRTGEALVSGRRFKGERAGTTAYTRDGQPINGHFFGQSSFATHSVTTADALVKVPGEASLELLGPLACGLATGAGAVLNEARPRLGDSVLIVGVGAVGLAAIMATRNSGVTKIIAADVHDKRLEMAQEFGATHTINSGSTDLVEQVRKITGSTVDFAIDCTGVIAVIEQLAETVGMLGTLVLVGGAPANATLLARPPADAVGQAGDRRARRRRALGAAHSRARGALSAGPVPLRPARALLRAGRHRTGACRVEIRRSGQADPASPTVIVAGS